MTLPGYVYFIATEDRSKIKIGWSTSPQKRFSAIQSAAPQRLVLLGTVPGTRYDERAIHAKFVSHHSHGEWFHGAAEILVLADIMAAAGEIPLDMRGSSHIENPLNNRHLGIKRTPEQCKRIGDGVRASHQRSVAATKEACRKAQTASQAGAA